MSSEKSNSLLLRFLFVLLLLATGLLAESPQLANVQSSPTTAQPVRVVLSTRELQGQVLDLLKQNDLVGAENLLQSSLDLAVCDSPHVHDWLSQYQQFLADRDLRRSEVADEHLAKAKEHIEQEKLEEALASVLRAVLASPRPQDIRDEDWLDELVALCAAKADTLIEEGKYGDAALILGEISHIFKGDDFWKERYEQAGLHASIQGAYGKDSDWQQRLRDVDKDDFERALLVIDKNYVTPVDYRKMLLRALKGFRLLLSTKDLDELFSDQPEQSLALARLVNDTDQKIESLEETPHVSAADLRKIYYQILAQNKPGLEIPEPVLVDLFTNQALQSLDDYTQMIWPDQQKWFSRTTTGSFTGIGVQIRINKAKQLEVTTPLAGTPAFRAGLQAGDLIVGVDGKTTKGITVDGAVRRITGKKDTTVVLTIKRPGRTEEFDVPIVRAKIKITSVFGYSRLPDDTWNYILDESEKIAYIRITNFMQNTSAQLDQAIQACREQGARALILDLRFNPGGTLRSAEEVSDRFLPLDKPIVSTRGRRVKSYAANALHSDSCAGWPLIVLACDKSASASEIVAGALQDHKRAAIVGERTFGKGLVQRPFAIRPWFDDSQVSIKVTTAYWYLPEGRNVQRSDEVKTWGVEPDFLIDLTPREIASLFTRWRKADIIHNANGSPADDVSASPQPPADSSDTEEPEEPTAEPEEPTAEPEESTAEPEESVEPTVEPEDPMESIETSPDDDATQEPAPILPDPQLETALLMARLELLLNQNQSATTLQN